MTPQEHIAEFRNILGCNDERKVLIEWYDSLSPEKQIEVQTFNVILLNMVNNPKPVTDEQMTMGMIAAYIKFNHPEVCP